MKIVGSLRPSKKSAANATMMNLVNALDGGTVMREEVMPEEADLLIQWGFKPTVVLLSCIEQRKPYVILDRGYFDGTRNSRYSLCINGFHGLSMQPERIDRLPPRWHPPLQPYKQGGEFVTIYGQLPGDQALRGVNMDEWMHLTAHEATKVFHRPARKRLHPKMFDRWEPQQPPLDSTFEETFVAVTWTSTVAVQTLIAGVPTVTMHPASPAFVATPHLLVRETFDREQWIHRLSYREYALWNAEEARDAAVYVICAFPQANAEAGDGKLDMPSPIGE